MLSRCRPVRPILPVPRGRSLQIFSGHAPERPNKVSIVSVGVDLVENDCIEREGAIHRPSRRHITMSRLCALRCSSHCWRMVNLTPCCHVTAPLDPLSTWDANLHVAACASPHFGTLDPATRLDGALVGSLARQVGGTCGARGACGSERSPEARRAAPKSARPVRRHRDFLFAPPTRPLAHSLVRSLAQL